VATRSWDEIRDELVEPSDQEGINQAAAELQARQQLYNRRVEVAVQGVLQHEREHGVEVDENAVRRYVHVALDHFLALDLTEL
jgi:hypothetical protein